MLSEGSFDNSLTKELAETVKQEILHVVRLLFVPNVQHLKWVTEVYNPNTAVLVLKYLTFFGSVSVTVIFMRINKYPAIALVVSRFWV